MFPRRRPAPSPRPCALRPSTKPSHDFLIVAAGTARVDALHVSPSLCVASPFILAAAGIRMDARPVCPSPASPINSPTRPLPTKPSSGAPHMDARQVAACSPRSRLAPPPMRSRPTQSGHGLDFHVSAS
ncbi:hypothetical protein FIBSPDRAFT_948039 [Athelia psychrophila]|uniref:Peptidase C37 domain-containing protein n=1 Tax=Athelia psychrophila TaxID=1759441 RepID=A0A166RD52_9AGAM|nr:hypothetical protein FIBSPDRAFT_948039 [Fibularhizoctonia sp. CBS 109695]